MGPIAWILVVAASLATVHADNDLFNEIWSTGDWSKAEIIDMEEVTARSRIDGKPTNVTSKKIPVSKNCKCYPNVCACCLLYKLPSNKQHKVCVGVKNEEKSLSAYLQVLNFNTTLIKLGKNLCLPIPQAPAIAGCFRPYGGEEDLSKSIRGCLQLNMKFFGVKMGSVDLDCFRLTFKPTWGFSKEVPKEEERPKKGFINWVWHKFKSG